MNQASDVAVTTLDFIPGKKIVKVLGIVCGNAVRARHIGRDILASLKHLVGGEIREYAELLDETRRLALQRMIEQARKIGANAVIGVRFGTSMIMQGVAEIYAYGTAVIVE